MGQDASRRGWVHRWLWRDVIPPHLPRCLDEFQRVMQDALMTQCKAVLTDCRGKVFVDTVEVVPPQADEVLVEIKQQILDLYVQGRLQLEELVTRTYTLDDAPQAITDMLAGVNAKGVLVIA